MNDPNVARKLLFSLPSLFVLSLPFYFVRLAIFPGIPIYVPEIILLVWAVTLLLVVWQGRPLFDISKGQKTILSFAILLSFGSVISLAANPFSLSGLGIVKSHFLFPILFLLLLFCTPKDRPEGLFWRRISFSWFLSGVGMSVAALLWVISGDYTYDNRLSAWFSSPNELALILVAPALIGSIAFFENGRKWTERLFLGIGALLLLFILIQTRSYGAVLALVSGYLVWGVMGKRQYLWRVIGVVFLVLTIFVSFEIGSEKANLLLEGGDRSSLQSRLMIWCASGELLREHWLVGIGPGRFQEEYLALQTIFPPYLEWAVPQPHNIVLAIWLQSGIIGGASFTVLILWLGKKSICLARKVPQMEALKTMKLGAVLLAAFLVLGVFDTPFYRSDLVYGFWLTVCLLVMSAEEMEGRF